MDIVGFGESVNGEFVAGCLIATVDGQKQYLYRDNVLTPKGNEMYLAWEQAQEPEPLPVYGINSDLEGVPVEVKGRRKPRTHVGD